MFLKFLLLFCLNFFAISAQQVSPRCNFTIENQIYVCNLQIQNDNIVADFPIIEGEHLPGLLIHVFVFLNISQIDLLFIKNRDNCHHDCDMEYFSEIWDFSGENCTDVHLDTNSFNIF